MIIEMPRGPLLDVLRGAQRGIPSKLTLPILRSALLETCEKGLLVRGTNLDVAVSCIGVCEVIRTGSIVVPAAELATLIAEIPKEGVLRLEGTPDLHLKVSMLDSDFHAKLACIDPSEYPRLPDLDNPMAVAEITQADLQHILDGVGFAVSTDTTRLSINGILWERIRRHLVCVATDGHRLSKAELVGCRVDPTDPTKEEAPSQWIVGTNALSAILPIAGERLEVKLFDQSILFRSSSEGSVAEVEVLARLIDGPYPNYQQVIPKVSARRAILSTDALLHTVRRVATLSPRATKQVVLAFSPSILRVSATNMDLGGEGSDSLPSSFTSTEPEEGDFLIGANATFLVQILKLIPTAQVSLKMNKPTQAILIEPVMPEGAKAQAAFILMPLRLAS